MRPFLRTLMCVALTAALGGTALAANGASIQNFYPVIDGNRTFTLRGSESLKAWQFHVGLTTNFSHNLLKRQVGGVATPIVDDLMMTDLVGAVGFADWFSFGIGIPIALWSDSTTLTVVNAGGVLTRDSQMSFGDIRVEPKFRILKLEDKGFGLAIAPIVLIPTGDENRFVGNGSVAGGGYLILDAEFLERARIYWNLGFLARKGFLFPGTTTRRGSAVLTGIGLGVRVVDWMDVVVEATASLHASDPFQRQDETPVEAGAGFLFRVPPVKGLCVGVGGSAGVTSAYGSPDYRFFLGVGYTHPTGAKKVEAVISPPAQEPPAPPADVVVTAERIEIQKKIHFEYGRSEIRSISYPILDQIIKVLKEHPDLRKVQIEGHTDSQGSDELNYRLSQERAEAIRGYLISHGVESERLEAKGFGESRPRDTNDTELGRARNRRVEFVILERGGTP